jgi:hypothetical protein
VSVPSPSVQRHMSVAGYSLAMSRSISAQSLSLKEANVSHSSSSPY